MAAMLRINPSFNGETMKNQKTGEDTHGEQVYVLTTNSVTNRERLCDFPEQHADNFFIASEGSEPFRQIQEAIVVPQIASQQNDSAPGFRENRSRGQKRRHRPKCRYQGRSCMEITTTLLVRVQCILKC